MPDRLGACLPYIILGVFVPIFPESTIFPHGVSIPYEKAASLPSSLRGRRRLRVVRYILWTTLAIAVLVLGLLRWGGYLLISDDPLPLHLDGAVVLQGSVPGENARVAGAMRVLHQETTTRILLSVPKESYWGQPVAPIAYAYIEKLYGQEGASQTPLPW